jgi:hypothetical protein
MLKNRGNAQLASYEILKIVNPALHIPKNIHDLVTLAWSKARPSGVKEKFFLPRSMSLTRNRRSRAHTRWLTALCVMPFICAALEKLEVSAKLEKTLND